MYSKIEFKIFSVRDETTAFERVKGKTCIERIVYANKECTFINYGEFYEINGAVIEWRNPPAYAEALLNKSLSKYGFKVAIIRCMKNRYKYAEFKIIDNGKAMTGFPARIVRAMNCLDDIIKFIEVNKECEYFENNFFEGGYVNFKWWNPPPYAEVLLNRVVSKYGFKALLLHNC